MTKTVNLTDFDFSEVDAENLNEEALKAQLEEIVALANEVHAHSEYFTKMGQLNEKLQQLPEGVQYKGDFIESSYDDYGYEVARSTFGFWVPSQMLC